MALASLYGEYVVLDVQGAVDDRRGIRLNEPGVEVVEVFKRENLPQQPEPADVDALFTGDLGREKQRASEVDEARRNGGENVAHNERVDVRGRPENCRAFRVEERDGVATVYPHTRISEEVKAAVRGEEKNVVETNQRSRESRQSIERQQKKGTKQRRHAQRGDGSKVTAMEWLSNRWRRFVVDMAEYVVETDEEEMRTRCEVEMDAWRDYCEETKNMSFQEMVMQTRIALRTNIPAPQNEWWNPETEEWEHLGLKYLNCSATQWEQMRVIWQDRRALLPDPEQIVARAIGMLSIGLMDTAAWPQLVVGIAVLTGQGLLRILKNGCFSQKTSFSLLVRDAVHYNPFFRDPFEVPTLGRADLVVEAWERVRDLVDCVQLEEYELLHRYAQLIDATASRFFHDIVPLLAGETSLFKVLHHCVYPCLATYYYCPPSVESVEYIAKICNDHLLLADPSLGERFACAAVCNYMEYRLADEHKGVWCDRSKEVERFADHAVVEVEFEEEEIADLNDIRQQMGFGLASATMTDRGEDEGDAATELASGTLKLSIVLRNEGLSPTLYEFTRLGLEHLRGHFAEFVLVFLKEEMLAGLKLQRPFEAMLSSELKRCDHPQAIYELARRAILMLIRQNRSVSDPSKRWYLNEEVIAQVIQKDEPSVIEKCLQDHKEEIGRHHHQLNLTIEGNVKSVSVAEVIDLLDDPGFFKEAVSRGKE